MDKQAEIKQLADQIYNMVKTASDSRENQDAIGIEALLLALHQLSGFNGFINILTTTQQ